MSPLRATSPATEIFPRPGTKPIPRPDYVSAQEADWQFNLNNPLRRLGFYSLLCLLFVRFSMVHQAIAYHYGISTRLTYIFGVPALAAVIFSGGLRRLLRLPPVYYFAAFVAWMVLATPFSHWRGGSFNTIFTYLKAEAPMVLLMGGLIMSWKECLAVMKAIALGAMGALLLARVFMNIDEGRIFLAIASEISNANDYAAHLIVVLPFLWWVVISAGKFSVFRPIALAGIGYGLFLIIGTGSRGGLVALIVVSVFMFIRVSLTQRVLMLLLIPILIFAIIGFVPKPALKRIVSFSADAADAPEEAVGSRLTRNYLLRKSLEFTVTHPIFGVGPGQFASYESDLSRSQGRRGSWHETHNSFTQVSSECGIPAFIFYTAALVAIYRYVNRMHKRGRGHPQFRDITALSFCLLVTFVGYAGATFFLTFAYRFYFPTFVGFVTALTIVVEREFATRLQQPAPVADGVAVNSLARPGFLGSPASQLPRDRESQSLQPRF